MAWFRDRVGAGQALARLLPPDLGPDWLVLALPRGGVPVAAEVARQMQVPLDLLIVRKVGAPGNPELALAAVTGPGHQGMAVNEGLRRLLGLSLAEVERLAQPEVQEIARRKLLWSAGDGPALAGRRVLIVDDGCATGTTLRAAVQAALHQGARQVGVALPVALGASLAELPKGVAPIVCPHPAADLPAVGLAYDDFPQVSDGEVSRQLKESRDGLA